MCLLQMSEAGQRQRLHSLITTKMFTLTDQFKNTERPTPLKKEPLLRPMMTPTTVYSKQFMSYQRGMAKV